MEAERIVCLNDAAVRRDGRYVLYWMQQSQRVHFNPALEHAIARGRAIAAAGARWYYGQNDAQLNRLRFGSAAGIKGVLATVRDRSDDQLTDDAMVVGGNPDSCARVVQRWADIGLDHMVFMMQAGNTSHDEVMRSLELIGEKVIPRFCDAPRGLAVAGP